MPLTRTQYNEALTRIDKTTGGVGMPYGSSGLGESISATTTVTDDPEMFEENSISESIGVVNNA
jgi:hypothetical protein